jgi:hypothetical protein
VECVQLVAAVLFIFPQNASGRHLRVEADQKQSGSKLRALHMSAQFTFSPAKHIQQ